jgi:thymidine phosphorylase
MANDALVTGRALEIFGRMVREMGGPADFAENWRSHLPQAPVVRPIAAPQSGYLSAFKTRDIGLAVIALGGGRQRPEDTIDHRTGFSAIQPKGTKVDAGEPIAFVHAADDEAARKAAQDYLDCVDISDSPVAPAPVILKLVS